MINIEIAQKLKGIFENKTFTENDKTYNVKFHFGDQKELNKWIQIYDKNNLKKYPLIWFVLEDGEPIKKIGERFKTNITLILFQLNDSGELNNKRIERTYLPILKPLQKFIYNSLVSNGFNFTDWRGETVGEFIPNYGVKLDSNGVNSDFRSTDKKGVESITTDIVDAIIFTKNCFINIKNC